MCLETWEAHPEVAEMIELQRVGIVRKQTNQNLTPPPCNEVVSATGKEATDRDQRDSEEPLMVNKFAGLMYLNDV